MVQVRAEPAGTISTGDLNLMQVVSGAPPRSGPPEAAPPLQDWVWGCPWLYQQLGGVLGSGGGRVRLCGQKQPAGHDLDVRQPWSEPQMQVLGSTRQTDELHHPEGNSRSPT